MEKRQYHRVAYTAPTQLRQHSQQWTTRVLDLSLQGALIEYPDDFEGDLEQAFSLEIDMQGVVKAIAAHGEIVHSANHCLGFKIVEMDIDSITELRRLIELNLADESLLQRDLQALAHS